MKKGFTLIELLAVMVILAVVLVIAVPMVLSAIDTAKRGAIESDAKLIIDAIEKKKVMDNTYNYLDVTEESIEEELNIKNSNYENLEVTSVDGKPSILIVGKGKWQGYIASGTYNNISVVSSDEYEVPSSEETKTYLVSNGTDDGWTEYTGNEDFNSTYSYNWVGYLGGYRNLWTKWNNIDIPKGSTIVSAKIQYKIYTGDWYYLDDNCETSIYFNDVGNAVAPANYADFESKVFTENTVSWNIPRTASDTWIDSPNISSIIQEIVDRVDWSNGNSMMLLHRRHSTNQTNLHARIFHSYESGADNAPKLVITYSP